MSIITINQNRKIFIDKDDEVWYVEKVSMLRVTESGKRQRGMFWVCDSISVAKKGIVKKQISEVLNYLKENFGQSTTPLKIQQAKLL
jgi:uncharacterized Zn finger protein